MRLFEEKKSLMAGERSETEEYIIGYKFPL
jgi:hypothetical protein